jgi:hypothetical protein
VAIQNKKGRAVEYYLYCFCITTLDSLISMVSTRMAPRAAVSKPPGFRQSGGLGESTLVWNESDYSPRVAAVFCVERRCAHRGERPIINLVSAASVGRFCDRRPLYKGKADVLWIAAIAESGALRCVAFREKGKNAPPIRELVDSVG